jgi:hypothetical protein
MEKAVIDHSSESRKPTLAGTLIFRAKATLLQLNRAARNRLADTPARFPVSDKPSNLTIIAESTVPLWTNTNESERHLLAGKVHNLRLAIRHLNGVEVRAGRIFSFWAQVGRASRWKGFVEGRELREGCLIPTIGGGLCQLSCALYDAALRAGFEIIERHAHSDVIPGSLAEIGRDATVFWNYVDLRFKSQYDLRIEAAMNATSLTIRIRGHVNRSLPRAPALVRTPIVTVAKTAPESCASCGVQDCFRHAGQSTSTANFGRAAYLVDEYWPEFDTYICATRQEEDLLLMPLNGNRVGKANYAWSAHAFSNVRQSSAITLLRAYQSRKLAMQGAARQRALLTFNERLASSYASLLTFDVAHVTVMQNLLPFLWRDGHLGGRTFDVLMTSLPMCKLHERLDLAYALHPESNTLADFRADDWLVQTESEALRHANRIITPHSELAALYKNKAVAVDWVMPPRSSSRESTAAGKIKIVFPASTVGRKGAYELREAIQGLDVQLSIVGTELEGRDFWRGISFEKSSNEYWLEGARAVVLPAFVEHKPRRLLEAIARDIPVIASTACGLENARGVINIQVGDVTALREEIGKLISGSIA